MAKIKSSNQVPQDSPQKSNFLFVAWFQILAATAFIIFAITLALRLERKSSNPIKHFDSFESSEILTSSVENIINLTRNSSIVKKVSLNQVPENQLKYWPICIDKWNPNDNLRTMHCAFEKLNIKKSDRTDWDIVWSIEGPGESPYEEIKELKQHQKINHFPGVMYLGTKLYMNTINANSRYILPFFKLPKDKSKLKKFIAKNPKAKFVQKNLYNRGVQVIDVKDMNDKDPEQFYQVFLDNPLLIDGHAFDIGVFVLITSINPLRFYRYNNDILLRFCSKPYLPFNAKDNKKYVVQEGHKSFFEMKSFGDDYRKYKGTLKEAFGRHLRNRGFNDTKLFMEMDRAIVSIISNCEGQMVDGVGGTPHPLHHFFELVRFDFMVDQDLNLYVMEVNMSPNLTPTERRYEEYSLIYEPLVYSSLQMIGAGNYHELMSRFSNDTTIINTKNVVTHIDNCINNDCINNCEYTKCQLCLPCLSSEQKYHIRESFREWRYQGEFVRLFPKSEHVNASHYFDHTKENNNFMKNWFHSMCQEDNRWC